MNPFADLERGMTRTVEMSVEELDATRAQRFGPHRLADFDRPWGCACGERFRTLADLYDHVDAVEDAEARS